MFLVHCWGIAARNEDKMPRKLPARAESGYSFRHEINELVVRRAVFFSSRQNAKMVDWKLMGAVFGQKCTNLPGDLGSMTRRLEAG
jgi:hypothetical protein